MSFCGISCFRRSRGVTEYGCTQLGTSLLDLLLVIRFKQGSRHLRVNASTWDKPLRDGISTNLLQIDISSSTWRQREVRNTKAWRKHELDMNYVIIFVWCQHEGKSSSWWRIHELNQNSWYLVHELVVTSSWTWSTSCWCKHEVKRNNMRIIATSCWRKHEVKSSSCWRKHEVTRISSSSRICTRICRKSSIQITIEDWKRLPCSDTMLKHVGPFKSWPIRLWKCGIHS